jgi:hypothetical protein
MALQVGNGSTTVMYPPGHSFHFPGKGTNGHIDIHVHCNPITVMRVPNPNAQSYTKLGWFLNWLLGWPREQYHVQQIHGAANWQAWEVIYYRRMKVAPATQ